MTILNKQELQIIQVFSATDIPADIIRQSNIGELVKGMLAAQDEMKSTVRHLDTARREQKDGNFIGNLWHGRSDKVQDYQIDLNKAIGRLTEKSSQLLIVNTILAKALNDQQHILQGQQHKLNSQAEELNSQNNKILEQQNELEKQQEELIKTTKGLCEVRGVSQEQAQKLIGCVTRIEEGESRINAENQALRLNIEANVRDRVEECKERLDSGFNEQAQRYDVLEQELTSKFGVYAEQAQKILQQIQLENAQQIASAEEKTVAAIAGLEQHREAFERQLTASFATQSQHAKAEFTQFSNDSAEFKADLEKQLQGHIRAVLEKVTVQDGSIQQAHETLKKAEQKQELVLNQKAKEFKLIEAQLEASQAEQQKSVRSIRVMSAGAAIFAVISVCWQVLQNFPLL